MRRLEGLLDGLVPAEQVPESLRREFAALVELGQRPDEEIVARLVHCNDAMPPYLCEELGLPESTSYARAVRLRSWC